MVDNDVTCNSDFPTWTCSVGTVAGYFSSFMWFLVLLPQLYQNYVRWHTRGLSPLWAVANFTASLVNIFFVYRLELPLYIMISAAYMPLLEFAIILQMWVYRRYASASSYSNAYRGLDSTALLGNVNGHDESPDSVYFTGEEIAKADDPLYGTTAGDIEKKFQRGAKLCCSIWGTVVLLQVMRPDLTPHLQWIAITLWSLEMFPQILLNAQLGSARGQAPLTVAITVLGKTADVLSTFLVEMPTQFQVLCVFSATTAFADAIQVIFYKWQTTTKEEDEESVLVETDEETKDSPFLASSIASQSSTICFTATAALLVMFSVLLLVVLALRTMPTPWGWLSLLVEAVLLSACMATPTIWNVFCNGHGHFAVRELRS